MAARTRSMASLEAWGDMAWLPTWKQMPSASAAWRVAISSSRVSPSSAPNLEARLSSECSDDTRRRTHSSRSVASLVARMILASSSIESSEKVRSEEHTSELQSLMRISYAVFCLYKKNM